MSTQPNNPIPARSKRRLVNVTYDPEPRRYVVRAGISFGLAAAFPIIICFTMYSTLGDFDKTEKMVDKLLPARTGLIGSTLGFYFGTKNSQS